MSMYRDFSPCPEVSIACRNAAGCGTETAVRVRTRSGFVAASPHPTIAPQSWPTTCTGPPTRSTRAATSSTSNGIR